MNMIS